MINIKKNISIKSFYRFVEFTSKLCGSSLPHERYKQITLDIVEAQSIEEINVKRLSNSFLFVLNNVKATLDGNYLNTLYYLLTGDLIDSILINKVLKRFYLNSNKDTFTKAVYIHNHILSLELNRKTEFAILLANYVTLKDERGALVPFGSMFSDYIASCKMEDEARLIFIFKQMENNSVEQDISFAKLTTNEVIELIKPNIDFIKSTFKIKILGLYGSTVKGVFNESSDVDFVIEFDDNLIDFEKGNLREKLAKYLKELINCKADLVYFDHALNHLDIWEMNNLVILINEAKGND